MEESGPAQLQQELPRQQLAQLEQQLQLAQELQQPQQLQLAQEQLAQQELPQEQQRQQLQQQQERGTRQSQRTRERQRTRQRQRRRLGERLISWACLAGTRWAPSITSSVRQGLLYTRQWATNKHMLEVEALPVCPMQRILPRNVHSTHRRVDLPSCRPWPAAKSTEALANSCNTLALEAAVFEEKPH